MADDDWRLAALLLARTGARVGEVVNLRSCDVDTHDRLLVFGSIPGSSKTGIRRFPLDDDSFDCLAPRAGRGEAPLLPLEGRGHRGAGRIVVGKIQTLTRRMREACEEADVPLFSPHGLRRMVVARLMRARVNPGVAATLTGHSVETMLVHYAAVTDDDRREAVELADLAHLVDPPARGRAAEMSAAV